LRVGGHVLETHTVEQCQCRFPPRRPLRVELVLVASRRSTDDDYDVSDGDDDDADLALARLTS
jgi:hypothetical protein